MSLTREECEQSLNHLIKGAYSRWYRFHGANAKPKYINQVPVYKGDYKAIQKYQQLIKEHFDNPPLTIDEIDYDDIVWFKDIGQWIYINSIMQKTANEYTIYYFLFGCQGFYETEFKENCFYRKQVEDDD